MYVRWETVRLDFSWWRKLLPPAPSLSGGTEVYAWATPYGSGAREQIAGQRLAWIDLTVSLLATPPARLLTRVMSKKEAQGSAVRHPIASAAATMDERERGAVAGHALAQDGRV
jgi:hypothetical protein